MAYDSSFNMEGRNEDMFFLSNGHISPVFYSTLARAGFFDVEVEAANAIGKHLLGYFALQQIHTSM